MKSEEVSGRRSQNIVPMDELEKIGQQLQSALQTHEKLTDQLPKSDIKHLNRVATFNSSFLN